MHKQFKELGKNGKKHGYILEVYITENMRNELELAANFCNTTPALIAHNAIIHTLEWDKKLCEIATLNERDE